MISGKGIGTGGSAGILGIPPFSIGSYRFNALDLAPWLYVALAFFFVSLYVIYRIIYSHTGKAFVAVRDNDHLAQSLGINAYRYKLLVFAISAS